MKIAIIQPGHDDFGLGAFYQRAFAALGHDVLSLAPLPPHDPAPATRLLRRAQAAWPGYLEWQSHFQPSSRDFTAALTWTRLGQR